MDISKKNITRNIIAKCLHSLAVLCCSGPISHTFLVGPVSSARTARPLPTGMPM